MSRSCLIFANIVLFCMSMLILSAIPFTTYRYIITAKNCKKDCLYDLINFVLYFTTSLVGGIVYSVIAIRKLKELHQVNNEQLYTLVETNNSDNV